MEIACTTGRGGCMYAHTSTEPGHTRGGCMHGHADMNGHAVMGQMQLSARAAAPRLEAKQATHLSMRRA